MKYEKEKTQNSIEFKCTLGSAHSILYKSSFKMRKLSIYYLMNKISPWTYPKYKHFTAKLPTNICVLYPHTTYVEALMEAAAAAILKLKFNQNLLFNFRYGPSYKRSVDMQHITQQV